jgi:putative ABC transport system permease protein
MKLRNQLKAAIRSLGKNKMRTFLTMLGIIIGVGSVIAMLAIGQGSRASIQAQIANLGTNLLTVYPSASMTGGVRMEAGSSVRLTLDDYKAVASRCPALLYSTPVVRTSGQLIASSQNWRTSVWGVYPDYFAIRNLTIDKGNMFSTQDDKSAQKYCVIGQTIIKYLFGEGDDPVGKQLRINKIPFTIIGTIAAKGQNAFGQDQDDIVIAPFTTVQERMLTITYINSIMVSAQTEKMIPEATDQITEVLKERHRLGASEDPDFSIRSQADISNAATATSKILTILLASIASISLLVGGIGIMNIMLVSVTERTREIGIRMGVGARGRDVLLQFLIEAMMISLIGGIIGVAVGVLASEIIAGVMSWPIVISIESIILSFLFSTAIGIFFGWYPARKAAGLNPIDALRYE